MDNGIAAHGGKRPSQRPTERFASERCQNKSIVFTYNAGPEEVSSVPQHSIDIDELPLSDRDEPAVSRVVVLQRTCYQDGICARSYTESEASHSGLMQFILSYFYAE